MADRISILMYHDVTSNPVPGFEFYSVTEKAFGRQMRLLALMGYSTIDLDDLRERMSTGQPLPSRAVVLTFDDGFQTCIDNAVPHLKKFGFSATFFVVPGLVGQGSRWLRSRLGSEMPLAGWRRLRELTGDGYGCGAHGLTHAHLTELPPDACRFELMESKRILEEQVGQPARHMAYPYGAYDAQVRSLAIEAGYTTVCAVRGGHSGAGDDPFALRRIVVSGGDSLLDFACRLQTAMPLSKAVRRKAPALGSLWSAAGWPLRRRGGDE